MMKKSISLLCLAFLAITISVNGQKNIKIELSGGGGYTAVDPSAYADLRLRDWGQGMNQFYIQALPFQFGNLYLGGLLGSQYLFWYSFKECDNCYTVWRDVDAWQLNATARFYMSKNIALEAAVGLYNYQEYITPGAGGNIVLTIPLGDKFYIPIKAGGSIILDSDALMIPIGLTAGLGFNYSKQENP